MAALREVRSLEGIKIRSKLIGWEVESFKHDKLSSEYIWLSNSKYERIQVLCNILNGLFFVFVPSLKNPIATNESTEFENVKWYVEILDILYRQGVNYADT